MHSISSLKANSDLMLLEVCSSPVSEEDNGNTKTGAVVVAEPVDDKLATVPNDTEDVNPGTVAEIVSPGSVAEDVGLTDSEAEDVGLVISRILM